MSFEASIDYDQLANVVVDKLIARFLQAFSGQPLPVIAQTSPAVAKRTLNEWLVQYEDIVKLRPYKAATVKNHKSTMKHVVRLWGEMPIEELKARHISSSLAKEFAGQASLSGRVQDRLKDVLQEAVINEWLTTNPVVNVKRMRVSIARTRLSLEVFQAMYEVAVKHRQAWVAPMMLLGLTTGQRRADLAKMAFDDVKDGYLHVVQQKEAGKGYGARVAIPLSLRLEHTGMSLGDVIESCRGYAADGPTLIRRKDGRALELSNLSARFGEVIRTTLGPDAYEEGQWPSLHELRSLSERLHRSAGVNTMELLGHSSQEMTDMYNDDRGLTAKVFKKVSVKVH